MASNEEIRQKLIKKMIKDGAAVHEIAAVLGITNDEAELYVSAISGPKSTRKEYRAPKPKAPPKPQKGARKTPNFTWSEDNVAKAKAMAATGMSAKEIGIALGTTESSVKAKLKRMTAKEKEKAATVEERVAANMVKRSDRAKAAAAARKLASSGHEDISDIVSHEQAKRNKHRKGHTMKDYLAMHGRDRLTANFGILGAWMSDKAFGHRGGKGGKNREVEAIQHSSQDLSKHFDRIGDAVIKSNAKTVQSISLAREKMTSKLDNIAAALQKLRVGAEKGATYARASAPGPSSGGSSGSSMSILGMLAVGAAAAAVGSVMTSSPASAALPKGGGDVRPPPPTSHVPSSKSSSTGGGRLKLISFKADEICFKSPSIKFKMRQQSGAKETGNKYASLGTGTASDAGPGGNPGGGYPPPGIGSGRGSGGGGGGGSGGGSGATTTGTNANAQVRRPQADNTTMFGSMNGGPGQSFQKGATSFGPSTSSFSPGPPTVSTGRPGGIGSDAAASQPAAYKSPPFKTLNVTRNGEGQPGTPLGKGGTFRESNVAGLLKSGVHPDLIEAVRGGSKYLPEGHEVRIEGGMREGGGKSKHTQGHAVDLQIWKDGKPIGADKTGTNNIMKNAYQNPHTYGTYEQLAQGAYKHMYDTQGKEKADQVSWGGRFANKWEGGKNLPQNAIDTMHYSLNEGGALGKISGPGDQKLQDWLAGHGVAASKGMGDVAKWNPGGGSQVASPSGPASAPASTKGAGGPSKLQDPTAFEKVRAAAEKAGSPDPNMTAAIAMHESAWLKKGVYTYNGGTNNPFGQTGVGPKGFVIGKDGQKHKVYNDLEEGVKDHVQKWGKSYVPGDPKQSLSNLVKKGYNSVNPEWSGAIHGIYNKAGPNSTQEAAQPAATPAQAPSAALTGNMFNSAPVSDWKSQASGAPDAATSKTAKTIPTDGAAGAKSSRAIPTDDNPTIVKPGSRTIATDDNPTIVKPPGRTIATDDSPQIVPNWRSRAAGVPNATASVAEDIKKFSDTIPGTLNEDAKSQDPKTKLTSPDGGPATNPDATPPPTTKKDAGVEDVPGMPGSSGDDSGKGE